MAQGFGPLAGQAVRTGGLFGGGLPYTTADGWSLDECAEAWPVRTVLLTAPNDLQGREPVAVGDDGACELRAFGFSETGLSFVIATSCDLAIFTRG